MKNQISQTKENIQLQKALDNLVALLLEIPNNANTPLTYRLKMLAVIVDASYLKRNLYVLLNNWKKKLPFIGEVGTEINWAEARGNLCDARAKDPYDYLFRNAEFSELDIELLPSNDRGEWSLWETDEKCGININSDKYGENLDSTSVDNIWYFCGKDFKRVVDKTKRNEGMTTTSSIENLKRGLRTLSYDSDMLLHETLDKELDEIVDIMRDLEDWMYKIQHLEDNKYLLDNIMASFFERLYEDDYWNDYKINEGKNTKEEYESWLASYNRDLKVTVLIGKQKIEFERFLKSGFLDIFLKEQSCEPCQVVKARKIFDSYFYDRDKNIRCAAAGRYIYSHQFTEDNWRKKTLDFFRFLYIDDMIMRNIHYLDKYYQNEDFRLESIKIAVKSSINKLMNLKDGEKEVIHKQQHWIAIYQVIIEENILDLKPSKYTDFVKLIKEISPEGFRVPLKLDSLKRISKTIYQKPIKEWKEDSNYESWDEKMPYIALTYRNLLFRYLRMYDIK